MNWLEISPEDVRKMPNGLGLNLFAGKYVRNMLQQSAF